jgi:hypothetical protein
LNLVVAVRWPCGTYSQAPPIEKPEAELRAGVVGEQVTVMEIGEPRIALCPENAARSLHTEVTEFVIEVQSTGYAIVLARISAAVTGSGLLQRAVVVAAGFELRNVGHTCLEPGEARSDTRELPRVVVVETQIGRADG